MERGQCDSPTQDSQETEHSLWYLVHLLLRRLVLSPYVQFLVATPYVAPQIRHTIQTLQPQSKDVSSSEFLPSLLAIVIQLGFLAMKRNTNFEIA